MNQALEFFKSKIGKRASDISPSGTGKWMDGVLTEVEENSLSVEFEIREEMLNPGDILHGGIAATMMDDVMGMTVFSLGRKSFYVTVNLAVDYLRNAKLGEKIVAKSQIVRAGENVIYLTCDLLNSQGKSIARCTSNMVKINFPK